MKKTVLAIALVSMLSLSGCAAVLIGGGIAGGVAASKDTAKLEKEVSLGKAWAKAHNVIKDMGAVTLKDEKAGIVDGVVQDSKIRITITQLTKHSVRIEVKARKGIFPNMDLAVIILNKINDGL